MTGHSSVNETLCTIVFSFAVVINHLRVSFCKGLLSVALLLLVHQDSGFIILQSTACLFKSKALSKYLLDLLCPTCHRNINYTAYSSRLLFMMWHFILYISPWLSWSLLPNNSNYSWHLSSESDFRVTVISWDDASPVLLHPAMLSMQHGSPAAMCAEQCRETPPANKTSQTWLPAASKHKK